MQVTARDVSFSRVLRRRDVIALSFGAMIGWSWVLMTSHWIQNAGSVGTLIAFVAGGVAITLVGLTYSELAAAMPQAGGEHVYSERALGRNWSFVCTWAILFAYVNVCLFEAVALPTAIEYLLPVIRLGTLWTVLDAPVDAGFVIVGVFFSLVVTGVNYVGIRAAAIFQTVATLLIVVAGLLLITGAIAFGETANAEPWIAIPATGILSVLIMVPAMLVGFDVIPQSAEEIDLPPHLIGRLLIVSVAVAVLWYVAIAFSVALGLDAAARAQSTMATADAASALWGHPWAGSLLVLGGIGGILTSWNAFIVGGSRVLFALAESGQAPAVFSRLHPTHHTPYIGIATIGVLSMIAPLFGRTILVWLIDAGSFGVMLAFLFVAISFLVLRKREPEMPRPFSVTWPRTVGWGAVVLSILLLCAFLPGSPSALVWPWEWGVILVWAALGVIVRLAYRS
ncbi:MAG: amino acid permease [Pseudomonadales bacterium]|nr:amino acid permease [Pseudomonadales bacterium]MCP5185671.1 amino acid permease [Pseudomonadales bacterium]